MGIAFFIAVAILLRFVLMRRNSTRRKAQLATEGDLSDLSARDPQTVRTPLSLDCLPVKEMLADIA